MTREEMLEALDETCDRYPLCSDGCPMYFAGKCGFIDGNATPQDTLEFLYNTVFNPKPVSNPVTHPSHYTQGNIECIDAMVSAFGKEAVAHFCICNAFKYTWRSEHKNGMEDIDKALWYLTKYKELKSSD